MVTNGINRIRERLKRNPILVSLYQRMIGYKAGGKQWCRVIMDRSTEEFVKGLPYKNLSVLEISGRKWANFGFASYTNKFYPEFDLCNDCLGERFDLIIAEQVFEHLRKPYRAGTNIYKMLKPGGYALITTPFLIKVHPSPDDCTRWSASGIRYFLEECGFDLEDISSDAWGNRACIKANFIDWIPYNSARHSLKNENEFPIVVWAFAKKQREPLLSNDQH